MIHGIDPDRLAAFTAKEAKRYAKRRPKSRTAAGRGDWLDGVPMHWMRDWPLPFPPLIDKAEGARLTCIDGHRIDDFCLGDTAAMFGHAPAPVVKAMRRQMKRGFSTMLPQDGGAEVSRLLTERFGEFRWQISTTATDANRSAIRIARAVTGRPKILVFHGCYHGAVDDAMVMLHDGLTVPRAGLMGQVSALENTVAVEFNDLPALEAALAKGDVAAILTEPALTNSAMVLPEAGYLDAMRRLATMHDTLLILDETHTLSAGVGGCTGAYGLDPDILVVGKAVAGGIPAAVWGLRGDIARRYRAADAARPAGHSGMGTTLSGNLLQIACIGAVLQHLMTADTHARMDIGAKRLAEGLSRAIAKRDLPWSVARLGARMEIVFAPAPLRNGSEAARAHAPELIEALGLGLLNRGVLISPFHNMMLVSPATRKTQIAALVKGVEDILKELCK